jgi:hypothetical protein
MSERTMTRPRLICSPRGHAQASLVLFLFLFRRRVLPCLRLRCYTIRRRRPSLRSPGNILFARTNLTESDKSATQTVVWRLRASKLIASKLVAKQDPCNSI